MLLMILFFKYACQSSLDTSKLILDSIMHSLMFSTPVPRGGGAARSINLSTWAFATFALGKAANSSLMTSNSPICMAFLSSWTSISIPGSPNFFFFKASRMSSGTIPRILSSSLVSCSSLTSAAMTIAVVVRDIPA